MKDRLHWLVMHGVIRGLFRLGVRRGDPQARMVADSAVRADPISYFDELRPRGPLIRAQACFLTLDHAVAHELLRSDDFRVIAVGSSLPKPLRIVEEWSRPDLLHPLRPPSLLAVEPPEHTRYRKTVSSVFTSRAVTELRAGVEATARQLLDRVEVGPDAVDVVQQYCSQLPVAVISEVLGVPDSERPKVLEFGELAAPSLDIGLSWRQYRRVQHGIAGFNEWLAAHLQRLRANPGEDLMSKLIDASSDGTRLDDIELRATAGLVLAAGFETTVNLLGNGIQLLLTHPEQLDILKNDPSLWPNAVEEILRFDSPVQMSARTAKCDTVIAGTKVRRGEFVVIYLAAANRDPAVFDEPNRFDVRRRNAGKHLAFSGGRHFCLGAALARAEGEVGLRQFFTRFPDTQLTGIGRRRDTRVLRGWAELPVRISG